MAWNIRTGRQISPDLEILRHQVNVDVAASIVLDASAVVPDADGLRELKAGTILTKNASNQYEKYVGAGSGSDTNEVQTVTISGAPTGGQFRLSTTISGTAEQTRELERNATAAQVQQALIEDTSLNEGDVTVTGAAGGPYTVTFAGQFAGENVPQMTATNDFTGGTTPNAVVATGTAGVSGARTIRGILAHTVRFPDGTTKSDAPAAMWNHGQWFRADRIVDWATHGAAVRTALPTCKFD